MTPKTGSIFNYAGALLMLAFGVIYLLKISFMPYHSEALGLAWPEVDNNTQAVILALMRTASGGLLAASLVVVVLQMKFSAHPLAWIPELILATGSIVGLTAFYATLIIRINTSGKPPTAIVVVGLLLYIIGYVFNRKAWTSSSKKSEVLLERVGR